MVFTKFSKWMAGVTGHPATFSIAFLFVISWLITGKWFHFSDAWQLVINTITNIVAFLMVFMIQNSQNRETHAVQIKLDELIRSIQGAHNKLINIEDLSEKEIEQLHKKYEQLAQNSKGLDKQDTDTPEV